MKYSFLNFCIINNMDDIPLPKPYKMIDGILFNLDMGTVKTCQPISGISDTLNKK